MNSTEQSQAASEAGRALGRLRTEKKSQAARRNVKKAQAQRLRNCATVRMIKWATAAMEPAIRWPEKLIFASERTYCPIRTPFDRHTQLKLYEAILERGEQGMTRLELATLIRCKFFDSSVAANRAYFNQFLHEARRRRLIVEEHRDRANCQDAMHITEGDNG